MSFSRTFTIAKNEMALKVPYLQLGSKGALSPQPPSGPGQSPGRDPGSKVPGSS